MKLRIQFQKLGPVRFTSHKDTIRMFQRCFASAGIPVSYSEGFHPHMRMSFVPPLKTGWEGHEEYMDLQVDGPPGEMKNTCNTRLPEGLRINHIYALNDRSPKIASDVRAATLSVKVSGQDASSGEPLAERAREFERRFRERFVVGAPPKGEDHEPRIIDAEVKEGDDHVEFVYTTTMVSGKTVAPATVLAEIVGDPDDFSVPVRVARRSQFVERNGDLVSPINKGVLLNQS
jgi:radical SAM-linked protein